MTIFQTAACVYPGDHCMTRIWPGYSVSLIVGDGGEADLFSWIIGLSQLVAKAVVFCLLRLFFFFGYDGDKQIQKEWKV